MRIAWSSDLHVDVSERNRELLPHIAARVEQLSADVLVIAGDVAETVADVQRSLEALAHLPCARLYVPGNHDLFAEPTAAGGWFDTQDKIQKLLPQAVTQTGCHYLGLHPVRVLNKTFIGTCGWFDDTLGEPLLAPFVHSSHFASGSWRHVRAYDKGHVLWPSASPGSGMPCSLAGHWAGDREICDAMLDSLQTQLKQADAQTSIVAVVHVLPFPEIVQRQAFGPSSFHDAWLGSARLGACLREDERVQLVISGHLHRPTDVQITPRLRAVASPVGDARRSPLSLPELARECVGCIDLP